MNPLDIDELKAFFKIMKKDMPIHTDNTVKIKCSFSQGMPKNLKEYSDKVDNKFLNDNLHTIEEMEYRKKGITNDFKNYQHKYYDESGILNHDLYFEHDNKIYAKVSGGQGFSIKNVGFTNKYQTAEVPPVNGAEFVSNTGITGSTNFGTNVIWANLSSTGTLNGYYDQIAINCTNSTGNVAVGCYLDNGASSPSTLLANNSGNAANSAYTYRSVTEFQITTSSCWLTFNTDSSSFNARYQTSGSAKYKSGQTYVTFANPFPASPTSDTAEAEMKCKHS